MIASIPAPSASFEVALDVCIGVVMSSNRDSFAAARLLGRGMVYHHHRLPRKESPYDLHRRAAPDQDLPAARLPQPRPLWLTPPPGRRLLLPCRTHVRCCRRLGHPLPGTPPRPTRPLPGPHPLVQELVVAQR